MAAINAVPAGISALPLEAFLLFAAPIAALLVGFFFLRPFKPSWTHLPILASCALVSMASLSLAARVYSGWGLDVPVGTWMIAGEWGISLGVRIDGLSVSVLVMVSVVGALIHLYASGYMREDPGFSRFFLCFHLFYLAMIGLLVSNSYAMLYLFWELVGLASYLLIGFWHHKGSARRAALQAFLANRLGDFGLILAVLILLSLFGRSGTRFAVIFPLMAAVDPNLLALIGVLLFWAAAAKSAQFPLYFWLPDAMEGPTPVSALMHAATMVTAGIFLLARSWPLIAAAGVISGIMVWVGAGTALGAALIAATRTDLKRILAYSTVSHLGLMTFALGLGGPAPAIFHLITHGFFKAVLFLCVGNITHALGQSTANFSEVGDLVRKMPLTFACFAVAALSLSGIWPFAGFYSKDMILDLALHAGGAKAVAGLVIGFLSSFYIFRFLFLAFLGPAPEQRGPKIHEVQASMAIPVFFLALGALGTGWLAKDFGRMISSGWPGRPEVLSLPEFTAWTFALGTVMSLLGGGIAFGLTILKPGWDWEWRRRFPDLEAAFRSDFGWLYVVNRISGLIRKVAGWVGEIFDKGICDRAFKSMADGVSTLGGGARRLSTGSLNDYLWWILAGAAAGLSVALR
jgi:NADH-quinone oxidoreductase subunit L